MKTQPQTNQKHLYGIITTTTNRYTDKSYIKLHARNIGTERTSARSDTMVDTSPLIPHRKKQGRRVLWIFDSRKAVISINFIGLVVYIVLLTLELTTWRDLLEHLNIFWLSTNIVFYIIVIVSALTFKHYVSWLEYFGQSLIYYGSPLMWSGWGSGLLRIKGLRTEHLWSLCVLSSMLSICSSYIQDRFL